MIVKVRKMSTSRNSKRSAMRNTSAQSKLDAIKRVHDGESKASVARDIGVPESTLRGWCKNVSRICSQSRQSSPDTDESLEPKEKKPKTFTSPTMVQPFNLSLKAPSASSSSSYYASQSSKALYTPMDYSKSEPDCTPKTPQNLSIKTETPKLTASQNTEREKKNRAELAKLSVEFGLNRPEIASVGSTFSDYNQGYHGLNSWSTLLATCQQKILQGSVISKKKTTIESSPIIKNSKLPGEQLGLEDYVNSWIQTQALVLQLTSQSNSACDVSTTSLNGSNISCDISSPSISRNGTSRSYNGLSSPQPSAPIAANNSDCNGKPPSATSLMPWYQEQLSFPYNTPVSDNKPILYQQLTKETNEVENLSMNNSNATTTTSKSILDNLLLANNNNNIINDQNLMHDISPEEAVEHGDKFMKWLESVSNPSVTAMQIMQFRSLLTNVRNSINPKNDEVKNKTKVRRK